LNRRLKQHPYVDGGNFYEFKYCPFKFIWKLGSVYRRSIELRINNVW
jgi:hypothetical protein